VRFRGVSMTTTKQPPNLLAPAYPLASSESSSLKAKLLIGVVIDLLVIFVALIKQRQATRSSDQPYFSSELTAKFDAGIWCSVRPTQM
jgi:hypothetical protein